MNGEPKSKIKLFLIYDLGNREIVGAKVLKFTKIKNTKKSFLFLVFFVYMFLKYNIINLKTPRLFHSDRGVVFCFSRILSNCLI